jgi:hypothetical protein
MLGRLKTRPRDPNQLAYRVMLESARQAPKTEAPEVKRKKPAVTLGRLGGLKGGAAGAAVLGPKKHTAIAPKSAKARWGKK